MLTALVLFARARRMGDLGWRHTVKGQLDLVGVLQAKAMGVWERDDRLRGAALAFSICIYT